MTDLLRALETALSDRPALTTSQGTHTGTELRERVWAVAHSLQAAGLETGDRVLFSVRPGRDAIVLALGIVKAGGTVVFADPGAGTELFTARMNLARPRWVAAESLLFALSLPGAKQFARSRGINLPDYRRIVPDATRIYTGRWAPGCGRGALSLQALERASEVAHGETSTTENDPDSDALIIFTSGTTSDPKAVVHTRTSLGAGLDSAQRGLGIRPGMRVLTDQLMIGVPALIAGAEWVFPSYGLDPGAKPKDYLEPLRSVDAAFLSPAAMSQILHELAEPMPHISLLMLGGAPVLPALIRRIQKGFPNATIRAIYGMTEILPVAIADGAEKLRHAGEGDYVGKLSDAVRATLETDSELVLAGPGLARAYLGELPNELDRLHTGDFACIDGSELTLLGRKKDMLIRDKMNIYPGLYEPIISTIHGVSEAVMVGLPDEIGDDVVVLVIVPESQHDAAEVQDRVRRELDGLIDCEALPDSVVVRSEIPRSGRSQKPDRAALVAALQREHSSDAGSLA